MPGGKEIWGEKTGKLHQMHWVYRIKPYKDRERNEEKVGEKGGFGPEKKGIGNWAGRLKWGAKIKWYRNGI